MRIAYGLVALGLGIVGFLLIMPGRIQSTNAGEPSKSARTRNGLQALYDFSSTTGPIVTDRSGAGTPVNLRITNTKAVRRSKGMLEVRGKTLIRSDKPASRIIGAIRRTGEISIEAWIRPADTKQSGPARIVTLSKNANERNFTLGQDGNKLETRLRTTKTSANGIPSLNTPSASLTAKLTHVVYTRDRGGRARIYINGKQRAERTVAGAASNWNESFRLALANELTSDRPWLGIFYLVAVYNRDLSAVEVAQNFKAGAGAGATLLLAAQKKREQNARLFETRVAPLLARRCLECHGWKSTRGRLDLSKKFTAFRPRKNGRVIVPGKSAASLLWKTVKAGDMPKDQSPLSPQEKRLLQYWIDAGAVWSVEIIEPSKYAQRRRGGSNWIRRLTVPEYIETVRVAVGVNIAKDAHKILPRDLRADGFSNTAYNLTVDLEHVHAYANLAEIIVGRLDVLKFAAKYSKRKSLNDAGMRKVISGMGKWLLRGPLNKDEVKSFLRISKAVAKEKGNYKEAVSFIVEAMLQSPRFIYRIENQRGDGKARRAGNYELASRLSYILWGAPPDRELMRVADAGDLTNPSRVATQVRRMLKDPRAVIRSSRFIYEWLNLDRLDNMRPNSKNFPKWTAQLAADMRDETLAFFHDVAWKQKRPLAHLLNAQITYATPRLAKHYGLQTNKSPRAVTRGLSRYDLSNVPGRGGLLTQGSVLTIGGDEASMVTRGLFVLHDLLDGHVDDPPPCVDTTPVPTKPGLTQRGVAMARIKNKACGGCHSKFEPLAFGLEKFDGLGAFHKKDKHGNNLRDDGEILFPDKTTPVTYKSSAELMNLLAESVRVRRTITMKVAQWALGRPLVAADAPILEKIHAAAQKGGGTYESVITAIVMSNLVQFTRTEGKK